MDRVPFHHRTRWGMGLTLIETLLVVVLLALVSAVLARGVLADSTQREEQRMIRTVSLFDATARALAQQQGVVSVHADKGVLRILDQNLQQLAFRRLDAGYTLQRDDLGQDEHLYIVDSSGRSEDCTLILEHPGGLRRLRVHGLTGLVAPEGASP